MRKIIGSKLAIFKFSDLLTLLYLPIALAFIPVLKIRKNSIWLICERKDEARDNGFALFCYCMESRRDIQCFYAIDKKAEDYKKIEKYTNHVIQFGSMKHWIYYLACQANISSQKNSGPSNLCGFLFRKFNIMNNKMFFLQHGTIINDCPFMHYNSTKFRLFCCGAWPEYLYVKKQYGYPEDHVAYTGGQCRHDFLYNRSASVCMDKFVLIMPTWRDWLFPKDPRMLKIENTTNFEESNYYRHWVGILKDEKIDEIANLYNIKFIFYPHPQMQRYVYLFEKKCKSKQIIIASKKKFNLQKLIKNASALITDYSSVFFDFIYMKKPIIFYQFDETVYRKYQYQEGYFSYKNNPFGKWSNTAESFWTDIQTIIKDKFAVDEKYMEAHSKYFPVYDNNNSKRTFDEIYKRVNSERTKYE